MRIISKFQDYYDGVARQGQDLEVIYLRNPIDYTVPDSAGFPNIRSERISHSISRFPYIHNSPYHLSFMFLGFCGKIYPILEILVEHHPIPEAVGSHVFYNSDDVREFSEKYSIGIKEKTKYRFISSFLRGLDSIEEINQYFAQSTKSLESKFSEFNSPTFVYYSSDRKPYFVSNVNLKAFQFFKIKDPYSAFQEIYMFISGVLKAPTNSMVTISDEDKISKHGFNEWSFRKLPSKK